MAIDLSQLDPITGEILSPSNERTYHIYPPSLIPSLRTLTDPSRCDLDTDDPIDESFLKSLVATGGNIEPVLARRDSSGQVWVFEGRRRLGATLLINSNPTHWAQFIPPDISPAPAPPPLPLRVRIMRVTEEEALRLSLHGNNSKPLTPMDHAHSARDFMTRLGWTQEKVAAEMGVSGAHISHLLRLLDLPTRVQVALHKGKLKVAQAQALYGHPADTINGMMDRFDKGENPKEIFSELRVAKREKANLVGKKLARSLAEFKKDLESSAQSSNVEVANLAGQLLDYLAGNESEPLDMILSHIFNPADEEGEEE